MPPDLLLAIDVGTQSVRAIVFDRPGAMLARAQTVPTPAFHAPQPGWAEQDAVVYWNAMQQSCQALWATHAVRPELARTTRGAALATHRALRAAVGVARPPTGR